MNAENRITSDNAYPYTSRHPQSKKLGKIKCLEDRATAICTNEDRRRTTFKNHISHKIKPTVIHKQIPQQQSEAEFH
jgi:hypothetical protein